MFISMLLDLKDRIKGCEHCETCSHVIIIIETYMQEYKKISKIASALAKLFILLIENRLPPKLSISQKKILDLVFIMIMKNSNFSDVEYIYESFKDHIDVNIFDGLAFRLAIQKHNNTQIKKMLVWGIDITVNNHRALVKAMHYQKFNIVKTLIDKGSSYKYYLMDEFGEIFFQFIYDKFDKLLETQIPELLDIPVLQDAEIRENFITFLKEYKFIELIKNYVAIMNKTNLSNNDIPKYHNRIDNSEFIYDFMIHLNIDYKLKNTYDVCNTQKKKKKKKKTKHPKTHDETDPIPIINTVINIPECNTIADTNTIADANIQSIPYKHILLDKPAFDYDKHFISVFTQYSQNSQNSIFNIFQ